MFSNDHTMLFGGGFMWLVWVLIIIAFVFILKILINKDQSSNNSAIETLKIRLARGDIDENEFQRKRKELEG